VLKREVMLTFVGSAVCVILGTGSAIITSRWLHPEGRGILALVFLIPALTSTLAILGQDAVNSTFAGLYKESRGSLLLHSFLFALTGGALSAAGILLFYYLPFPKGNFSTLDHTLVHISLLYPPLFMLNSLLIALVRGVGQIAAAAALRVLDATIFLVLLLVFLVWLKGGVLSCVYITSLGSLVSSFVAAVVLFGSMRGGGVRFDWPLLRKGVAFGFPICLATFATLLVYRVDQGILAYVVSNAELGIYAVAVGLAEKLKILPGSISAAFLPTLANDIEYRRPQVPRVFRITLVVSAFTLVVAAVVGAPAILLMYGFQFARSIWPYLLLLPGLAALGGASVLSSDLLTREKPKYSIYVSYLTLALSATLNILIIPLLGIKGAALVGSTSYFGALALWAWFYRKESGEPLRALVPRHEDFSYVMATTANVLSRARRRLAELVIRPPNQEGD
jgi:O-antigen/teichoic acid export membrane protein